MSQQMSEEIRDAHIVVPRAIVISLFIGGSTGLATFLGVLFGIGNPDTIVNSDFKYPFGALFLQVTKSVAGSAIMAMVIILLQAAAVIGLLAAASRMLWSFSRDRGVPGWRHLSRVSRVVYRLSDCFRSGVCVDALQGKPTDFYPTELDFRNDNLLGARGFDQRGLARRLQRSAFSGAERSLCFILHGLLRSFLQAAGREDSSLGRG